MKKFYFISFASLLVQFASAQTTDIFVHTIEGRPIPNVQLTANESTDSNGTATVNSNAVLNPTYMDGPNNGVDLRDAVRIRKHVTNEDVFDSQLYWMIGDFNNSQGLSTLDIVMLQRSILKISDPIRDWQFVEMAQGDYLGFKLGDVDDSALLEGDVLSYTGDAFFWSQELTANQEVVVDMNLKNVSFELIGAEIHIDYDPSTLDFHELIAPSLPTMEIYYNEPVPGELIVSMFNNELDLLNIQTQNDFIKGFLQFRFTPYENGKAKDLFTLSSIHPSFVLDEDCQKEILGEEFDELISSNNEISFTKNLSIFPNPVNDRVHLDFVLEEEVDFRFEMYAQDGRKVLDKLNKLEIDVSQLINGAYFYVFSTAEGQTSGKLLLQN